MIKVVFFGSSKHVIPIIETLRKHFNLALVVTTDKLPTDPVVKFCSLHKVQYYIVLDFMPKKIIKKISESGASLGVLAYFGIILPSEVLKSFPKGIVNTHPSLLPKYRGPTPVQTAILNGDKVTGVTIIKLDEQVDHGPILAQREETIRANETTETLHERLFNICASMLSSTIKQYNNGTIIPKEQNHKKATFTKQLRRESGFIDINNPPPHDVLERMIRAYYPWPGVWSRQIVNNKSSIIKFLPEKKIQVEGKKPMSYKDFLNGYPDAQKQLLDLLV